jgi:tRNA(Ile)-lysidine synthase
VERGAILLLAVSGGGDSQAMLDVLGRLRAELGVELRAHGVDHGLRPEANGELELARALAHRHGIHFGVTALGVARGPNLQARARAARWGALRAAAEGLGATAIATAHHAEDRAETVLLRLLRGAGPRGLAVLPPRDGLLVRPLIRAPRAAIVAHLSRHQIPFATDPSNSDPRFLRVRVRQELLPLLGALSPRIVDHLVALADQLRPSAGGPTPPVLPPETTLGRAQRTALERAWRLRLATARVWLPGGRTARIDPKTGEIELGPRDSVAPRRRGGVSDP